MENGDDDPLPMENGDVARPKPSNTCWPNCCVRPPKCDFLTGRCTITQAQLGKCRNPRSMWPAGLTVTLSTRSRFFTPDLQAAVLVRSVETLTVASWKVHLLRSSLLPTEHFQKCCYKCLCSLSMYCKHIQNPLLTP